MKNLVLVLALSVLSLSASTATADGGIFGRMRGHDMGSKGDRWAQSHASGRAWHGSHNYLPYGQPLALVVPPNAIMQQTYSWGVSQNLMMPTYHQYGPSAVPSAGGSGFYGTPRWPSHTSQFGVYNVRAPW